MIWDDLSEVAERQKSVVTIGNFDGVHKGHRRVVGACVDRAAKRGVDAVALTFDPHPATVHRPDQDTLLITSLQTRLEMLEATGLDATLVATYDEDLYCLEPEEFVTKYLVEGMGAVEVVVGEDFRFGKNNAGSIATLQELGAQNGFSVAMVTDILCPSGRRWSSSWVRELLLEGHVDQAADVLGHPYRVVGTVEHGAKRGRLLGFPTANLSAGPGVLAPADGVYAGWLIRETKGQEGAQEFLPAAISVGTNPQFDTTERTIEAHVLGRSNLDLYGEEVSVVFTKRIRPMQKFESVEELQNQMDEDLRNAAEILGARVTGRVDPKQVTAGV